MDVKYFYYLHGSLARVEKGQDKVQGMDFAYNLEGWLKGINSTTLDPSKDIGKDAHSTGLDKYAGADANGFSLGYYKNDYAPITGQTISSSTFTAANRAIVYFNWTQWDKIEAVSDWMEEHYPELSEEGTGKWVGFFDSEKGQRHNYNQFRDLYMHYNGKTRFWEMNEGMWRWEGEGEDAHWEPITPEELNR